MSGGVYVWGVCVLWGKCPGGKCPGGYMSGGKCPGGKCSGGFCPVTNLVNWMNSTMKTLPIIALGVINTKGLVTNYGEGEGA